MTAPKPGPAAQLYCSRCATWQPFLPGVPGEEQRRAHASRCLGVMTSHPELREIDALLERIAALYLTDAP